MVIPIEGVYGIVPSSNAVSSNGKTEEHALEDLLATN